MTSTDVEPAFKVAEVISARETLMVLRKGVAATIGVLDLIVLRVLPTPVFENRPLDRQTGWRSRSRWPR
jgi:hypothetical protein